MKRPAIVRLTAMSAMALAFLGVLLLALSSGPAEADATFTVNRTGDASDRRLTDTVCDTSRKRGKQCTLRAAIEEANDTENFADPDVINFAIGGTASVKTISPASPLPEITGPTLINGYTQRGARENTLAAGNNAVLKVQLRGADAGPGVSGLTVSGSSSTIKGLVINRFGGDGIEISGSEASFNQVEGNFIGTNTSGTQDLGNTIAGVRVEGANNDIGGTASGARNVISGNDNSGITIAITGTTGNEAQGNYIGTDADGITDLGNANDGVFIGANTTNNTIGGTAAGAGNLISGNDRSGVQVNGEGNQVEGNFIGTAADGTGDLGNEFAGVLIQGGVDNTIGGAAGGARNIISANDGDGVNIFLGAGNSILSNRIFQNVDLGIDLEPSGVTNNDTDDPDTGANNLQNFPVITSVVQAATFLNPTRISGTLNSNPNQNFTVQCFLAGEVPEDADPSGHGEGRTFMAEDADVTTNTGGDASFECNFLFPISLEGKRWSATATNEVTGDTSEFSANFPVE